MRASNAFLRSRRARTIWVFKDMIPEVGRETRRCSAGLRDDPCPEPGHRVQLVFGPGKFEDPTSFSTVIWLCDGHADRARQEASTVRVRRLKSVLSRLSRLDLSGALRELRS